MEKIQNIAEPLTPPMRAKTARAIIIIVAMISLVKLACLMYVIDCSKFCDLYYTKGTVQTQREKNRTTKKIIYLFII